MVRRSRFVSMLLLAALVITGRDQPEATAAGGPPKIRTINPTYGSRGGTVDVVIEGSNLFPFEDVSCSANDVNVIPQPGANDHRIVLRLTIPEATPAGSLTLKIKTKDGTVTTDRFQVRLRSPSVSKVTPDAVRRGGTYDLSLAGSNLLFTGNDTSLSTDEPMKITRSPKSTEKMLVVTVVVPQETPPGPHPIVIETTDGKFTATFQVLLSPPGVTGIDPATVTRGRSAVMTLKGTNLLGATVVFGAPDDQLSVVASGEATATAVSLKISAKSSAAPGPRLLVLQTADGIATATFEVETSPPKSLLLSPPGSVRGTTFGLTASGEDLPADAELRLVPQDPSVRLEKASGGGWKMTVAADARIGPRTVVAVANDGVVAASFNIGIRPPSVAGVVPAEVAPGTEADLAFEGQNLDDVTYALLGDAAGVEGLVSSKPGMFHVKVAPDARPGPRIVVLRTSEGTAVARFLVTGPSSGAPSAKSGVPGRVMRGRTTLVTVKGMNLRAAGNLPPEVVATAAGGGKILAKIVDSTPSSLTLEVQPAADADLGGGTVTITTPDGIAAVALQVDPALPSVASVSPDRGQRPSSVEVTLVGTNLAVPGGPAPKLMLAPSSGGAPFALTVATSSPDKVTAKLALGPATMPGSYLLFLDTAEGGAAIPFHVDPAPPKVTSVMPASVGTPTVADLVLLGMNLLDADGKPPKIQVTRLGATAAARADVVKATADAVTVRVTTVSGGVPGPHFLLLRTSDGVAAGVFQVVASPPPEITAIDQAEGGKMSNVLTIVHGTGLKGATAISFDGKGVVGTILPGGNDLELHVRIAIAADAEEGSHRITVTAPGGIGANEKVVFKVK